MTPETRTHIDDVDDVVAIAAAASADDADTLSRDELRAIGAEVGLGSTAIDGAIETLSERRERERRTQASRAAMRRLWLRRSLLGACLVALVTAATGAYRANERSTALAALETAYGFVDERRSNLVSARERRLEVERIAPTLTDPLTRDAERLGAANRVSVAERRYAEAARAYEALLADGPARDVCGGVRAPCAIPTADAVGR